VIPGPHSDQSMCPKVGFIVLSTISEMYTASEKTALAVIDAHSCPADTYRPSRPGTCNVKNVSTKCSDTTSSSRCCLFVGVELAHSNVLRLRMRLKSGRLGEVVAVV
jgi:hypothetical protein